MLDFAASVASLASDDSCLGFAMLVRACAAFVFVVVVVAVAVFDEVVADVVVADDVVADAVVADDVVAFDFDECSPDVVHPTSSRSPASCLRWLLRLLSSLKTRFWSPTNR